MVSQDGWVQSHPRCSGEGAPGYHGFWKLFWVFGRFSIQTDGGFCQGSGRQHRCSKSSALL